MNFTSLNDGTFVLAHPLDAIDSQGNVTLPSGDDFLRADFSRAGPDLLIETPSGSHFIVVDYFMAAASPALVTSDGAVLSAKLVTTLAGPVAPGQVAQLGFGAPATQQDVGLGVPIGQVNEAEGQVTVTHPDGTQETLLTGGSVFQGDVLQTAAGASVSVIFVDDTVFSLAEDGRMVLDEMVYDASAQTGVFKAEVVQGVFSFVSGQVAKTSPDGMVVSTPTTTIGIRG
ncbi:FecR family protein, partial [Magnetovibrio blakemorei]|uniref:FecR family protein n=1 Tax=Magnetovibrio blakemorei TaxID=28181 RepID=UPI0014804EC1